MTEPNNGPVPEKGSASAKETASNNRGPSNRTIALILGVLAIIGVTAVAIVMLLKPQAPEPEPTGVQVSTQENYEQIQTEVEEKVAQGMFETHMNTTWTFPDGSSPSPDAIMGNAASNNYDFYFTVDLPTGEQILESGILPVGSQIPVGELALDTDLDAGTYDAVVNLHMVDENGEPIEIDMGINVIIVVEA